MIGWYESRYCWVMARALSRLKENAKSVARGLRSRWLRRRALKNAKPPHDAAAPAPDELRSAARGKLGVVADIMGCSGAEASQRILERTLAAMPDKPKPAFLLPTLSIKSCERIGEELMRIALNDGRVFTGHRSNQKEFLLHQVLSQHLPEIIDGDAYKLAVDIERRYYGVSLPWYFPHGGNYVEGGCYTGMRAIRWADLAIKPKRILAVEIGGANFEILRTNIADNGLANVITPVHAGLWRETGEGVQKHSFSTRRFLESTDDWKTQLRHEEKVRLLTLPDLLDENAVDIADYVNIQVNGAEIEVLKSFRAAADRIKVISVAAYYSQDGVENADVVEEMLVSAGGTVLQRTSLGRISAVTSKFRDEILPLKDKESRRKSRSI